VAFELDGHVDGDRLLVIHCEEVDVEAIVLYGMELQLVKDHGVVVLSVEGEVDDVGIRSGKETLEVFLVDGEENVLDTVSIKIARYEALLAESLDDGFVSNLAGFPVKSEMLHFS
jgi:hypothetical protein